MEDEKVLSKLNQIAKLLALFITQDSKTKTGKVMNLVNYGFNSNEISELLGLELRRVNETIKKQKQKGVNEDE